MAYMYDIYMYLHGNPTYAMTSYRRGNKLKTLVAETTQLHLPEVRFHYTYTITSKNCKNYNKQCAKTENKEGGCLPVQQCV